jgi:hypothetical protein
MVRAGVWTRSALGPLADDSITEEGWDEEVIVRFRFGKRMFRGTFVLSLLQEWRAL